ncbi:hypothetical protein [Caldalkalibacillus salinus]|uniref:hypothetical protein n=1 Tax=Caldalkalibacillus salinus TaxID=2803787 RepID=UPI001923B691|nr:hypothetical protein [Caldalkalibacillus salinus]
MKMNGTTMNKGKIGTVVTVMLAALLIGTGTSANNAEPGTAEDPLITKSYMDEKVAEIKAELRAELSADTGHGGGDGTTSGSSPMVVERLEEGQKLIGEAGTEIIVRTGQANGIIGPGGDGIPDVTAGNDIRGTNIPLNHLLLIPRSDGRGIEVIKGPSHVMIRGNYEIE